MHSYNAILSLDSLLAADSKDTIYAGLSQALDYTGLSSLSYMSSQHSSAVTTKMSTMVVQQSTWVLLASNNQLLQQCYDKGILTHAFTRTGPNT